LNFALESATRSVEENQEGLKLNGTHQLLAYVDNVNTVGKSIDAMKKNIEMNPVKTKYMLMLRNQEIGQKHSIKIGNRSFEDVAEFK
jgi:hypothetical protein